MAEVKSSLFRTSARELKPATCKIWLHQHQEHNNHDQEEDYLSCALYNDRNDDQDDDQDDDEKDDQDDQDDDRAHLSCALDDDRAERLQRGKRVVSLQPGGEYYYKGSD